jgi:hypothetical protein
MRSGRERDVAIILGANTRPLHLLTGAVAVLAAAPGGFIRTAASVVRRMRIVESAMKTRNTDDGRFLGLDFADWSMLIVGFTVAGFLALYI